MQLWYCILHAYIAVDETQKKQARLKQSDSHFIVGLQQSNGSWLLNDQLAGTMSKSVQEL